MAMVPAPDLFDVNLLVSSSWRGLRAARREIRELLRALGDERPTIERTLAKGIIGVRTSLEPRAVIRELRAIFERDPGRFQFTSKWAPIDLWAGSDLASLGQAVTRLRERIGKGETWRMTVEKRRYTRHHRIEVITALAQLIDERVDLTHPDKIVKIDLIGDRAALAVLKPEEIFSVSRPRLTLLPGSS
jgi:tRNA(Ser,Leu) C12 N-acetylase TAN1